MAEGHFVAYYRVSTQRQGVSGLGLEAQRETVLRYLNGGSWSLVGEFTEVESGANDDRPELAKAMATCRLRRATLVIAKLDRLSRDVHFLTGLSKQGVKVRIAEMPEADETWFNMMAVFAQHERKQIGARTRAALAAKKARGERVGDASRFNDAARRKNAVKARATLSEKAASRAKDILLTITDIRAAGITTLMGIAEELNRREFTTTRGKQWSATQVMRVIARVEKTT